MTSDVIYSILLLLTVTSLNGSPVVQQAGPVRRSKHEIVTLRFLQDDIGDYDFNFETSNGIQVHQVGLHSQDPKNNSKLIFHSQGGYAYRNNQGNDVAVTYSAGVDGFQPESDILPTTPEPPLYVQSLYMNGPRKKRRRILF